MSFSVNPWKVVEHGWNPDRMRAAESLTSLANGYMGMRGNFEEDYSGDSCRGTYLGGVWAPDATRVGWWKNGYPRYYGRGLNAVNLIGIHVTIDGTVLDLNRFMVWDYVREVDMRTGVFHRTAMIETEKGSMQLEAWRFVSMAKKELAVVCYTLTPSFDAKIGLMPYLDGDVRNERANTGESFWDLLDGSAEGGCGHVTVRTRANPYGAPRFTVCAAQACRAEKVTLRDESGRPGFCSSRYLGDVKAGETVVLEKFAAVYTDRDHPAEKLTSLAEETARRACNAGWDAAFREHVAVWADRWEMADVQIEGDDGAQQGIRFNLFHLLSTYSGEDARLNIGPKGFTGEKYGGATYWDTEAYCLPVFMAVSGEKAARQLLLYRFRQLQGAYDNARDLGLPGALFPVMTYTGRECHNEWEITFEAIHRNAAMVYAIYTYTAYTGDAEYQKREGFEVMLGVMRFWEGRAQKNARTGKYMLLGVTGPNDFENNVSNNWYTNRMAAWSIDYFLSVCEQLGEERLEALYGVEGAELALLRDMSRNMYYPVDRERGVFAEHDGFMDKKLETVADIDPRELPIADHWSWDRILRSCFHKQGDVLQGLYFLDHLYGRDTLRRNFDFYEPMTVHESSLSASVHCVLAARLGCRDKAAELYKRTARLDLDDINGNTCDGLHVTGMPGSWLAIAQGFAGMRYADGLSFAPFLPDCWKGYSFKLRYRGRVLQLTVRGEQGTLLLVSGEPVRVRVFGRTLLLSSKRTFRLKKES